MLLRGRSERQGRHVEEDLPGRRLAHRVGLDLERDEAGQDHRAVDDAPGAAGEGLCFARAVEVRLVEVPMCSTLEGLIE